MDLLDGLNERQVQAVTSASPIILALAGAGSGKTTVLTRRVANLNLNYGINTENMLCLTFTRLAGREMKERVIKLIGDAGNSLFSNTFHAFAVSVLKKHGKRLGIDENFSIYDQEEREEILKKIIRDFGNKTSLTKVLNCFATCDDYRIEIRKRPYECKVLMEYGYRCKQNNAVDLDRLIDLVIRLWTMEPLILQEYRKQYKFVFVDEFQDTNKEQAMMVDMLQADNLFVVGDDFQAIYGWRGAEVKFILEFANKHHGCEVIKLEDNYRSTEPIITAANKLIKNNVNQTDKTLIPHKQGEKIDIYSLKEPIEEFYFIRDIIEGLVDSSKDYSDIAVLARTNKFITNVEQILKVSEIPYIRLSATEDPLKSKSAKIVLDWLNLISNLNDDVMFKKCARHLEASERFISEIELDALQQDMSMYEALNKNSDGLFMKSAIDDLLAITIEHENCNVLDCFQYLADSAVLHKNLYRNDIDVAIKAIERWMESVDDPTHECTPAHFLQYLKYKDVQDRLIDDKDAVKLMTVHASKGLEFDTVILGGMNQGVFPSKRGDIEEERRLDYVAVTRAKNKLYITNSQKTETWNGILEDAKPSQFIFEMGLVGSNFIKFENMRSE